MKITNKTPFGYMVADRIMLEVPREARIVRAIYEIYDGKIQAVKQCLLKHLKK